MRQLLHYIAFSDHKILKNCSDYSSKSQLFIGGVILLTGVVAAISMTFAIHSIFHNVFAALAIGLLWGRIVISFDRGIFLAVSKWAVVLRFAIAIAIGIVVSVPLEIKIFEDTILEFNDKRDKLVLADHQDHLQQRKEFYTQKWEQLDETIRSLSRKVDSLKLQRKAEEDGSTWTGSKRRAGKKKQWEIFDAAIQLGENELQTLIDKQKQLEQKQIGELEQLKQDATLKVTVRSNNLVSQYIALAELESQENEQGQSAQKIGWGLRILFVFIELFPALLKLTLPTSEYTRKLQTSTESSTELFEASIDIRMNQAIEELAADPDKIKTIQFGEDVRELLKANQI